MFSNKLFVPNIRSPSIHEYNHFTVNCNGIDVTVLTMPICCVDQNQIQSHTKYLSLMKLSQIHRSLPLRYMLMLAQTLNFTGIRFPVYINRRHNSAYSAECAVSRLCLCSCVALPQLNFTIFHNISQCRTFSLNTSRKLQLFTEHNQSIPCRRLQKC